MGIQRAFASSFQIDLPNVESERFWYSKESMMYGECNVAYNVESHEENHFLLTKTLSHQADCTQQNYQLVNSLDGETCKGQKKMTPKLFNKIISEPEEKEFLDTIGESFESEEPLSSKSWFRIEFEDLHYVWHEEKEWNSDVDLKEEEMFYNNEFAQYQSFYAMDADIVDDQQAIQDMFYVAVQDFLEVYTADNGNDKTRENINNLHKNGILVLTPYLMKMNYDSLFSMKERLFEEAGEVRHGDLAKNLFRELVSATGSNPSALLVKEMVMKQEYENDFTAARELLAIPFHIYRPTQKLVEEFKELMEFEGGDFVKMAAPLAYSTLVRRTCERFQNAEDDCEEELLKPAVKETFAEFESVDIRDIRELSKYMSMFSNFRWGGVHEILKPLIFGETDHKDLYSIRAKAIQAAAREIINNGLEEEYFLPLIMDEYE